MDGLSDQFAKELEVFWEALEEENSATILGWQWTYTGIEGDTIADSANVNRYMWAFLFTKNNYSIRLVREGYLGDYNYLSVGAETLESLTAFLSDIGLPDAPIVERYVFFLIW